MMMAGLDGIKNKIEPPAPIDKSRYDLPPEERGDVTQVPGSLTTAPGAPTTTAAHRAAVLHHLAQDRT